MESFTSEDIAEKIFELLEPEDLLNCCLVSKKLYKNVKNSRTMTKYELFSIQFEYKQFLDKNHLSRQRLARISGFKTSFDYFADFASTKDMKTFVRYMRNYVLDNFAEIGDSPLEHSIKYGHHRFVELLTKSPQKFNGSNSDKQTPLIIACIFGRIKVVKVLLESDKDLDTKARDSKGKSAIIYARKSHNKTIINLIQKYEALESKCESCEKGFPNEKLLHNHSCEF